LRLLGGLIAALIVLPAAGSLAQDCSGGACGTHGSLRLDLPRTEGVQTLSITEEASLFQTGVLSQAHFESSSWSFGGWQFVPTASVTYVDENALATIPALAGTDIEMTRFTVGPELKRQIDVGLGSNLEPFAFFKTTLDFDNAMVRPGISRNTIGGGVLITQPEGYSIQAVGDYTETLGTETPDESLAGKVMVSVPLP
jgi:hypothetical protein